MKKLILSFFLLLAVQVSANAAWYFSGSASVAHAGGNLLLVFCPGEGDCCVVNDDFSITILFANGDITGTVIEMDAEAKEFLVEPD